MSLRYMYVKHFDLNILKFADNLILHGNLFQRMAELYANDFFIIFVFGTPVSSTNKTDRHDITEILLKVALNSIKQTNQTEYIYK